MLHVVFLLSLLALLSLKELLVPHDDISAPQLLLLFHCEGRGVSVDLGLECVTCLSVDLLSQNLLPLRLLLAIDVEVVQTLALPRL